MQQRKIWLDIPMAKVPKRLPVVLSREDIGRLFAACGTLRTRTVLMTTYAAGLRVSEVCALHVSDIESAPDRMCLKVRQGKGGQDRYTLLRPGCWRLCGCTGQTSRPRPWLFPNKAGDGPMNDQTAQRM
ncbi:MAG: tyrosine-type recombinase/integrase [Propionivibrio sp.]|uniref:tyrosine-type recombinase/integrase n=1 Tax=Propionivibrio sp. TaxID=2212460 RepID=UPI0025FA6100|nr:tyrosine-type recombinase/integrase [Propionivibrio sp.]MBK8892528.1 tyrosine-type recombinase/integrase [Propionivibrio sp.]